LTEKHFRVRKIIEKKQFESDKMNEKTMKDKKNWSPKEES
jgi:hypothetical protein